jgi:hypothetical protein
VRFPTSIHVHQVRNPWVSIPTGPIAIPSRPRGSVGSPPERGAEAYTAWPGHVLAPDPRLVLIKVRVLFVPESRDPAVSGLDPTQRGPGPIPGVRLVSVEALCLTRRSGPYIQGSGTSHGVRTYFLYLGGYHLLWPRGGPAAAHVVGSGVVCHVTSVGVLGPTAHPGLPLKVLLGVGRRYRL